MAPLWFANFLCNLQHRNKTKAEEPYKGTTFLLLCPLGTRNPHSNIHIKFICQFEDEMGPDPLSPHLRPPLGSVYSFLQLLTHTLASWYLSWLFPLPMMLFPYILATPTSLLPWGSCVSLCHDISSQGLNLQCSLPSCHVSPSDTLCALVLVGHLPLGCDVSSVGTGVSFSPLYPCTGTLTIPGTY